MKFSKKKKGKVKIPAPAKRPEPDQSHPEYKRGRADYRYARKFSRRFVKLLIDALWLSRKTPVEKTDQRYGWYLYCEAWNDSYDGKFKKGAK